MILIDMHCHSNFSDGRETPTWLAKRAKNRGISFMALTDHDTTEGVAEFRHEAMRFGIKTTTGIEFSAEPPFDGTLHILAFRYDPKNEKIVSLVPRLAKMREERNTQIAAKLQKLGYNITLEEVEEESGCGVVARPHFARLLTKKGLVNSEKEAFIRLLARGAAAYVNRQRLSIDECFDIILSAGGLPVLAHPVQCNLSDEKLDKFVAELKEKGLWGLEAFYGTNTAEITKKHLALAKKYNLATTAGSDFHSFSSHNHARDIGLSVDESTLPWAKIFS